MKQLGCTLLIFLLISGTLSCSDQGNNTKNKTSEPKLKEVKKNRADGTMLSVTQVDEEDYAHGLKVTFYEDGRRIHSKVTFNHGLKHGIAVWYYKNGKVFEQTNFANGRREGLTKKYHKTGQLLSQCTYEKGDALPGLLEYATDGSKITTYPSVNFRKIDKIAFENTVILEISSSAKSPKVKYYYLISMDNGTNSKSFLDVKNGVSTINFYVKPGTVLMRNIEFFAELPTKLGNTLVKKVSYQMAAKNRR